MEKAVERLIGKLTKNVYAIQSMAENSKDLKEEIDCGYVSIRLKENGKYIALTFGVDRFFSKWEDADFTRAKGLIHLEGDLVIDCVKFRCLTDINLVDLQGSGRLKLIAQ